MSTHAKSTENTENMRGRSGLALLGLTLLFVPHSATSTTSRRRKKKNNERRRTGVKIKSSTSSLLGLTAPTDYPLQLLKSTPSYAPSFSFLPAFRSRSSSFLFRSPSVLLF
eukprot:TRINITY_DN5814_c0_g1_i3.p1 TRINITY_DN5814_c0_g1~~TRINITY_DN5814_c0_g1_i3.p1  ORF type:complete len:111 (+),score=5.85 TRINITY_DN5814_c0_g1_i3:56-388(+)